MDFEKKYWSKGEFTTYNGNSYIGYVGISDGKAYVFETEEELYPNDTYICRINCSNEHFDRTLSHELKLPYDKNDIVFAANDFLYNATLKTAVERLEANNNYIFRNSIISNSNIPNADICPMLASDGNGQLHLYDFAEMAFENKTNTDLTFYETTKYESSFNDKDILGQRNNILSENTVFIDTPEKRLEVKKYEEDNITGKTAEDLYSIIYGKEDYKRGYFSDNTDLIDLYKAALTNDPRTTTSYKDKLKFENDNYFFNNISGKVTYKAEDSFNIDLKKDLRVSNIYSFAETYKTASAGLKITINELYFIIRCKNKDKVSFKCANIDIPKSNTVFYSLIKEDCYLVKISAPEGELVINYPYTTINLTIVSDDDYEIICTNSGDIQFSINFNLGSYDSIKLKYKLLPKINKSVTYQYVWVKDSTAAEPEILKAPVGYTYKYLKESPEWFNAPNPKLKFVSANNSNKLADYIPEDNMCASDAFAFMMNNITSYKNFPDVYKNVKYTYPNKDDNYTYTDGDTIEYVNNIYYPKNIYNIRNYDITENDEITNTYKSALDVYNELKMDEPDSIIKWDRIPFVEKTEHLVSVSAESGSDSKIFHNFNEITSVNLAVKDITDDIMKLIIFLAFKNKLIIFPLDYNIGVNADENNTNGRVVVNLNQESISLSEDDIIKNMENGYICIENIDPTDNTSLKFLNLNAIKVYKKMMYLVDNKLNMVLRYDIENLFENTVKTINGNTYNTSFVPTSIKLLNILQGLGDSTDKIYFNNPYSVDVNDSRVYIADRGNNCIKVYTPGLNYLKTLKNGFFSTHDIQAVGINPCGCIVNDKNIKPESLWIVSAHNNRLYISILSDDIVIDYGQIEDISLQPDKYTWVEEIRGINFSGSNSNYFYINTNKRVFKFHTSKPYYPFAALTYFNQRSLANILKWRTLNYPWHKLPSIYNSVDNTVQNQVTWSYRPPAIAAEILDNKCFSLVNIDNIKNQIEGDFIFHFGVLYDNSRIVEFIKEQNKKMTKEITFNDIPSGELAKMIKSAAMLLYKEPDAYITSLSNPNIRIYDTYEYNEKIENDYINTLSFNKMLYAMVFNLLRIKNDLIGHFKAATNIDNVIVYDNLILDDYFNNLQIGNDADYFIHDNELTTIIINRTLENIFDLQKKIINHMQTTFMASQSWVNNVSRII